MTLQSTVRIGSTVTTTNVDLNELSQATGQRLEMTSVRDRIADMDFRGGALVAQTASWFELNDRYEFCTSGIVNENVTSKSRQEYAGGFNGNLDQLGKKLVDILFASLPEGAAVLVNDEQKKVHIESGHILFV